MTLDELLEFATRSIFGELNASGIQSAAIWRMLDQIATPC
jgi:hypothetical protein